MGARLLDVPGQDAVLDALVSTTKNPAGTHARCSTLGRNLGVHPVSSMSCLVGAAHTTTSTALVLANNTWSSTEFCMVLPVHASLDVLHMFDDMPWSSNKATPMSVLLPCAFKSIPAPMGPPPHSQLQLNVTIKQETVVNKRPLGIDTPSEPLVSTSLTIGINESVRTHKCFLVPVDMSEGQPWCVMREGATIRPAPWPLFNLISRGSVSLHSCQRRCLKISGSQKCRQWDPGKSLISFTGIVMMRGRSFHAQFHLHIPVHAGHISRAPLRVAVIYFSWILSLLKHFTSIRMKKLPEGESLINGQSNDTGNPPDMCAVGDHEPKCIKYQANLKGSPCYFSCGVEFPSDKIFVKGRRQQIDQMLAAMDKNPQSSVIQFSWRDCEDTPASRITYELIQGQWKYGTDESDSFIKLILNGFVQLWACSVNLIGLISTQDHNCELILALELLSAVSFCKFDDWTDLYSRPQSDWSWMECTMPGNNNAHGAVFYAMKAYESVLIYTWIRSEILLGVLIFHSCKELPLIYVVARKVQESVGHEFVRRFVAPLLSLGQCLAVELEPISWPSNCAVSNVSHDGYHESSSTLDVMHFGRAENITHAHTQQE